MLVMVVAGVKEGVLSLFVFMCMYLTIEVMLSKNVTALLALPSRDNYSARLIFDFIRILSVLK